MNLANSEDLEQNNLQNFHMLHLYIHRISPHKYTVHMVQNCDCSGSALGEISACAGRGASASTSAGGEAARAARGEVPVHIAVRDQKAPGRTERTPWFWHNGSYFEETAAVR